MKICDTLISTKIKNLPFSSFVDLESLSLEELQSKRLKQQIKEKAKVNKTLETKKPQQMQRIGTFVLGGEGGNPVGKAQIRTALSKASLLFLG